MAESTRKKKEEPIIETPLSEEIKAEETITIETPEEPEEIIQEEGPINKLEVPEQAIEVAQMSAESKSQAKIATPTELDKNLTHEERIVGFLYARKTMQAVRLNDFLKSLYPMPEQNAPPTWKDQGAMKRLRVLLDNMQSHGQLKIQNNRHAELGKHYFKGTEKFAAFYDLDSTEIFASL